MNQAIKTYVATLRPELTWDELDVVIPIIAEYPYFDYTTGMFYLDTNRKSHSLKREAEALKKYRAGKRNNV